MSIERSTLLHRSLRATLVPLVAASGLAHAQVAPKDVPPDHWAYAAVQDLASKGLLLGYPDGSFIGSRALTRYEMAVIVQRVLVQLDKLIDQKTQGLAAPTPPPPPPAVPAPSVT